MCVQVDGGARRAPVLALSDAIHRTSAGASDRSGEGMSVQLERGVPGPRDDRQGLLLRAPYNETFIDEIKSTIPQSDRYWSPALEGWWLAEECEDTAIALLLEHYGEVMLIDPNGGDELIDRHGRSRQERLL